MECYYPLQAFQCSDGSIMFGEKAGRDAARSLWLSCGQCIGCKLRRSRAWAVRCMNEAQLHAQNCFITLTYSRESFPDGGSLQYSDFQKFMKRLRARFNRVRLRFFMCGEYGEQFARPHFHACIFGFDFPDKVYLCKSPAGSAMFRSPVLEELWTFGFSSVGSVTLESAGYVARYCTKKITGKEAPSHYEVLNTDTGEITQRVPEFAHMSLKPGVGAAWLDRFRSDVYPHGKIVVKGVECRPPRYYDKLFEKYDGFGFDAMQFGRHLEAQARSADNSRERLLVKEKVQRARVASLARKL